MKTPNDTCISLHSMPMWYHKISFGRCLGVHIHLLMLSLGNTRQSPSGPPVLQQESPNSMVIGQDWVFHTE